MGGDVASGWVVAMCVQRIGTVDVSRPVRPAYMRCKLLDVNMDARMSVLYK